MAGRAKDIGRGWSEGNTWSDPVPLSEAVDRAPVFIRLEDGHRGPTEELSLSAGDTMALEGVKVSRGLRLVMAHHTSEPDEGGDSGRRCALLTLPYERLPDIDVCIMEDPDGHFYSNFLATNFPDCNWKEQQAELLESLDEHDYTNVSIITPRPRCDPRKENRQTAEEPPAPPPRFKPRPKPRSPRSKPPDGGGEEIPCPPRPPKPRHLSMAGTPPDTPPPRPPRRSSSYPVEHLQDDYDDVDDDDSDSDALYDVVDESKMDPKYDKQQKRKSSRKEKNGGSQAPPSGKPTGRVTPQRREDVPVRCAVSLSERPPMPPPSGENTYEPVNAPPLETVTSPLVTMSVDELCARLEKCGMEDMATTCKKKSIDGALLIKLNDDTLTKPPFSLDNFQKEKLKMVKNGWVPRR